MLLYLKIKDLFFVVLGMWESIYRRESMGSPLERRETQKSVEKKEKNSWRYTIPGKSTD